jgi:hypothetical protein
MKEVEKGLSFQEEKETGSLTRRRQKKERIHQYRTTNTGQMAVHVVNLSIPLLKRDLGIFRSYV